MDYGEKVRIAAAHKPHWSSAWVWVGFVATFFLAEGLLLWALLRGPGWLIVPLLLFLSHLMHAHQLAFHEAAHRTLCPGPRRNDAAGLFIGTLSFLGLTTFRALHRSHHTYLATERDEELWPFVLPRTPRWARRLAVMFELSLGILYTPWLCWRIFLRSGSPIQGRERLRAWAEYLLMATAWAAILAAVAWASAWKFLLVMFVVPGLLAGNLHSLRKYIEHMGLTGSTVLSSTRSVVAPGIVGRLVAFSLFNIPYHGIHHRYARIPEARLPQFTELLTPARQEELAPYPTYRSALKDMLRSLSDPKVGAQWKKRATENAGCGIKRWGEESPYQSSAVPAAAD